MSAGSASAVGEFLALVKAHKLQGDPSAPSTVTRLLTAAARAEFSAALPGAGAHPACSLGPYPHPSPCLPALPTPSDRTARLFAGVLKQAARGKAIIVPHNLAMLKMYGKLRDIVAKHGFNPKCAPGPGSAGVAWGAPACACRPAACK